MSHVSSPRGYTPSDRSQSSWYPVSRVSCISCSWAASCSNASDSPTEREGGSFFLWFFHGVFGTVVKKGTSSGFAIEDNVGSMWFNMI